jgi:hypothetical protein
MGKDSSNFDNFFVNYVLLFTYEGTFQYVRKVFNPELSRKSSDNISLGSQICKFSIGTKICIIAHYILVKHNSFKFLCHLTN